MPNPLDYATSDGGLEFVFRGKGRKITYTVVSPTVEDRKFYAEDGTSLMATVRVTWTDGAHAQLLSIERTT